MNFPKRHHFLPESYLSGFAVEGRVCVFDREKKEYRWQQVSDTAVIKDFYTVINRSDERDCFVERFLSGVESKALPVIRALDRGEAITPAQRIDLGQFISLLFARTPKFEREITEVADRVHKIIAKELIHDLRSAEEFLQRSGQQRGSVTPESMLEFVQKEQFYMKGNRNIAVRAMLDQTEKVMREVILMDWCIGHSETLDFITTDSPLGFIMDDALRRSGEPALGLASPKVTKVVPLTCRTVLLIGGHHGARIGHFNLRDVHVRQLSIAVATECERFVIGKNKLSVRHAVRRSNVHKSQPGTRLKVENIWHPTDPKRSYLVARRVTADMADKPLKAEFLREQLKSNKKNPIVITRNT